LTLLGAPTSVACAAETAPAQTVNAFYNWYVTKNGRVGERLAEVRALFEPTLYGALSQTSPGIFLANTCAGYVDVGRCPYGPFDPIVYAQTAASSYTVGSERFIGNRALVDVTLRLSGRPKATSHVTVVLSRRSGSYAIADLQYPRPHYYNFGPIIDLRNFLMLIGLVPLDPSARRNAGSAAGVVKAFYDLYLASHGHIEEHMLQAKALLDNALFDDLSSSYATGAGFTVRTCSDCSRSVPFDPFANASSPASSYAVGAPRNEGDRIFVPVALRYETRSVKLEHITVVVYRRGASYAIGNIVYDEPSYYYAGPVGDLVKFLSAWNC
jgi:hypothetical protein